MEHFWQGKKKSKFLEAYPMAWILTTCTAASIQAPFFSTQHPLHSTPRSSSFCYSGGAFLFSQPSSQQNLKNDAFCSSFWCWFQEMNKLMLYFAGHDCVHHWPFDVQEVRTCKGGALLRFFESEENMSDSTPKWRQSPQTVAEGKYCNMLLC